MIRKLKWCEIKNGKTAYSSVGTFKICFMRMRGVSLYFRDKCISEHETMEEAQEAAQKKFEAIVEHCLDEDSRKILD